MNEFPNDNDGMALRSMADHGVDMSNPICFEFYVDSPDEETSEKIKIRAVSQNYEKVNVIYDEGELEDGEKMTQENAEFWPSWTVYAFVTMVPSYEKIVQIQKELDQIATPLGGRIDGWGIWQERNCESSCERPN